MSEESFAAVRERVLRELEGYKQAAYGQKERLVEGNLGEKASQRR